MHSSGLQILILQYCSEIKLHKVISKIIYIFTNHWTGAKVPACWVSTLLPGHEAKQSYELSSLFFLCSSDFAHVVSFGIAFNRKGLVPLWPRKAFEAGGLSALLAGERSCFWPGQGGVAAWPSAGRWARGLWGGPMVPPSPSRALRWPGLFDRCSSGGSISHELREWSMRFNLARNLHLSEVWRRNHVYIDLE